MPEAPCTSEPKNGPPIREPVLGVPVSVADYEGCVAHVLEAARARRACLVTALAVHGVMEARARADVARALADFDIVAPDGQPVRHALHLLHGRRLSDRVYGPRLMSELCARAAAEGLGVYLYGSRPEVVARLAESLVRRHGADVVAGAEPSLFRPLSRDESVALAERIRASGAAMVFIGLGCPRQELFAHEHADLFGLPQICVGAAFDFHAGTKRQAPRWMQDNALEWLFRLAQEPRRLLRRYTIQNAGFAWALARALAASRTAVRRST